MLSVLIKVKSTSDGDTVVFYIVEPVYCVRNMYIVAVAENDANGFGGIDFVVPVVEKPGY